MPMVSVVLVVRSKDETAGAVQVQVPDEEEDFGRKDNGGIISH